MLTVDMFKGFKIKRGKVTNMSVCVPNTISPDIKVQGKRCTTESPEATECRSTGGDAGQASKKDLLMFYFFLK